MKIITERAVYVQKNDMAYLNQTDLPIPASIYMKVYGNRTTIIDNSNRYEFIKFDDPGEIEFFASLDWIIDYNELKDLTEEELIEVGQNVAREKNKRAAEFNKKPAKEQRKQYDSVIAELELFDYTMYSIRDLIMFKKGELDFALPKGIKKPAIVVAEQDAEDLTTETPSLEQQPQESGIKKFIKSIFKKEKNK